MIAYKMVLEKFDGRLVSTAAPPPYEVEYRIGQRVTSDKPLFCSPTPSCARTYSTNKDGTLRVFRCRIRKSRKRMRRFVADSFSKEFYDLFWKNNGQYSKCGCVWTKDNFCVLLKTICVTTIILADAVTLLEEVK